MTDESRRPGPADRLPHRHHRIRQNAGRVGGQMESSKSGDFGYLPGRLRLHLKPRVTAASIPTGRAVPLPSVRNQPCVCCIVLLC